MFRVASVSASYNTTQVLNDVSLTLDSNEVLALIGRNGVGKTTLMRTLIGLLKPINGTIQLDDKTISGLHPHAIARLGIVYVPQGRGIFPKLSVYENLLVGTRAQNKKYAKIPNIIFDYFPILKERLRQPGGTLSGGEQQMLAIARALCGEPKILLLDEPSEGIQPSIVQEIGDLLLKINADTSLSVLIVEQNIDLALHVANRFLVMEKGEIVYEGDQAAFNDQNLVKQFLAI